MFSAYPESVFGWVLRCAEKWRQVMNKVRLADIAEQVGVSTVTVHNALNGQKGVSDEVRARIRKVADEMGYHHGGMSTKPPRDSRFRNVGVIISEKYLAEYTTFYWKMYQEMAIVATDKNCLTPVEILKREAEARLIMPRIVGDEAIDGLIMMGEINKAYIHRMKQLFHIPMIFLDFYDKELAENAVVTDNFYGMYLLTEYLFEQGIRKIAYVGSIHAASTIMDRYCGFYRAMMQHGVPVSPEWVLEDRNEAGELQITIPEQLPEAFVCNCDLVAGMVIVKLEERGIRVPEDISVVGFDNYLYPGFPDKRITTYEVNMRAMAKVALDKVLKMIRNPGAGRGLDIVSGRIVEKESVRLKINVDV